MQRVEASTEFHKQNPKPNNIRIIKLKFWSPISFFFYRLTPHPQKKGGLLRVYHECKYFHYKKIDRYDLERDIKDGREKKSPLQDPKEA
jgi:hypothetical protein